MSQLVRSSWKEYSGDKEKSAGVCEKDIILGQFGNRKEYRDFAKSIVKEIIKNRKGGRKLDELLID